MAYEVRVKMLRAVGGFKEGDARRLSVGDAERLQARGVVEIVGAPSHSAAKPPAKKKRGAKKAAAPQNKKAAAPANKSAG